MLLKNICGKLQTGMRGEEKPDAAFLPGQKGSHPPLLPEQHVGCQRENKKRTTKLPDDADIDDRLAPQSDHR